MSAAPRAPARDGEGIAGRYELLGELGRGGMAVVQRVRDRSSGRELAMKRLAVPEDHPYARDALRLFEREFHTLAQLAHPRIIEVYEYGVAEAPYYTMELLNGGDLRELSPLPWQQACRVAHDVCSSLALLHSRGLVHRDVSTRNIRCTRDGLAKLIDFGAMMPMGPCTQVVGTAPFVAPEVVNRSTVDARTDLFSLGATLYSALTGRTAYRARHFSELAEVWRTPPRPPSLLRDGIPPALDELVMSLLALDPGARPRSASEVMARLAEIAGLPADESLAVRSAYLFAPALVGRAGALRRFERHFVRARRGRGGGIAISGSGRSRMLDACVLSAKVSGATVLRCNVAGAKSAPWAVAQTLVDQLIEGGEQVVFDLMPQVLRGTPSAPPAALATDTVDLAPARKIARPPELARAELDARALGEALREFLLTVAQCKTLVIAIDDMHRADEPSLGVLCGLAAAASNAPLLLVATLEQASTSAAQTALELFAEHAGKIKLERLTETQSEALLRGVFGDVPHLANLNAAIHAVADGSPRALLECAQHLVDRGVIHYESGSWKLPAVFDRSALPSSIQSALHERVARLSPLALRLGRCQALSGVDRFAHEDFLGLPIAGADSSAIDAALDELVQQRVLARDGQVYSLAHTGWTDALTVDLGPGERKALHRTLAELCIARERHPLIAVRHLFDADDVSAALDRLSAYLRALGDDIARLALALPMTFTDLAALFERAEQASIAAGRPPREVFEIRSWVMMTSAVSEDALYHRAGPTLLAQLEHDSGLTIYRELDPAVPAGERIGTALGRAFERYTATPESERVFRPDEAIKMLVYYAGVSIAIGTRTNDELVLEPLPGLLEPFAALSPIVHTIWQNAIATIESTHCALAERARARWLRVFEQLQTAAGVDAHYVEIVSRAVAFALACCELRMGIPPSSRWLDLLDTDILQCVSSAYLRRAWRVQLGDVEGAERYRRQAELLTVHSGVRPLFTTHLPLELAAYASAYDYAGLREARQRIEPHAAVHSGWVPYRALADAYIARTRGNVARALALFDRVLEQCEASRAQAGRPRFNAWMLATAGRIEALVDLDRAEEGAACGQAALARCAELEIEIVADPLRRALALCEAKLGRYAEAAARLDRMIASQTQLGSMGVVLGASHEARARIAIWAGDAAAFELHAAATARQYRRGQGSALGARYERLVAEARRVGLDRAAPQSAFSLPPSAIATGEGFGLRLQIESAMADAVSRSDRALCALRMLCEAAGAREGHLYLLDADRLELVATFGEQLPPAGLPVFLKHYLAAETDSTNAATVIDGQTSNTAIGRYEPGDGRSFRAIPLVSSERGLSDHVGIAALALSDARDRRTHAQLAGTLAQYLIDIGDCTGAHTSRY